MNFLNQYGIKNLELMESVIVLFENEIKNQIKISHPGAFTDYCKKQGFSGVTCDCICKAMASNDKTLHKRANFAYNFGFKKKGQTCSCMEKQGK